MLLLKKNTLRTTLNTFHVQITAQQLSEQFPMLLCSTTANTEGTGKTNDFMQIVFASVKTMNESWSK